MSFPSPTGPNSYIWNLKQVYIARQGNNWPTAGYLGIYAGGGVYPAYSNVMDYINLSSTGNAIDWGDLISAAYGLSTGSAGSSTRGLFAWGATAPDGNGSNVIQYITFATKGNSTDFGDMTMTGRASPGGLSSSTRAIFAGPRNTSPGTGNYNIIEYVTIATTGNSTDFGDRTIQAANLAGVASSTRGVFGGGNLNTQPGGEGSNVIDYVTIATTGNATDFGDLTQLTVQSGGLSNSTRGIFMGGFSNPGSAPYGTNINVIAYITIASTGNATDFGDLTDVAPGNKATSDSTTGAVFAVGSSESNVINKIIIATTGNATDFGDLTVARNTGGGGASANHGGLQ